MSTFRNDMEAQLWIACVQASLNGGKFREEAVADADHAIKCFNDRIPRVATGPMVQQ